MATRSLPVVSPEIYSKFNACVHCGLCLPACPTYVETLDEADSPRGRVLLMKALVDGRVNSTDVAFEHLDRCLVCRACETACPSGVEFHTLMEEVRPQVAEAALGPGRRVRSAGLQWMVRHVLPFAKRARMGMTAMRVARAVGLGGVARRTMPAGMRGAMEGMDVDEGGLPMFTPAKGTHRGSVVLLRGCVGSVVSGGVNRACVKVLTENGFDVHLLGEERCCGALAAHGNDPQEARQLAGKLVEGLLAKGGDAGGFFVSPIAGCGAQLKVLNKVLAGTALEAKANEVVGKMRDVCEFLVEVGVAPPAGRVERKVTYHDPCHLAHAQRVTAAPRQLLGMVPGLQVVPLTESDMCCGAAGTYSMNQPEMAEKLGRRKVENIVATEAEELVTANVGCALQIGRWLREMGREVRVRHVVEVLAEAYGFPNSD